MTVETESREVETEEMVRGGEAEAMEGLTPPDNPPERAAPRRLLPWIGTLPHPHLVPMVALNDSGYLVPLWTASDLLRGCKYFWHLSQE